LEGIDCSDPKVGERIVEGLQGAAVEVVVYVAGLLKPEVSAFGERAGLGGREGGRE